jgi:hypothetical protein
MSTEAAVEAFEQLNLPAGRLRQSLEWIDRKEEVPPQVAVAMHATIWMVQVDAFRELEDRALASGDYQQSLDEHRAVLSQLIADGEQIVWAAKQHKLARLPTDFTLDDLQATIESLRVTLRCQHGPKNPPRIDQLIGEIFDVPQPKD